MSATTYAFFIDWGNNGTFVGTGENVTSRVLGTRASVQLAMGRDIARALSGVSPAQTELTLNNRSADYSPENGSSPIAGLVVPGRTALFQATHNAVTRDIFRGYVDGYTLEPDVESGTVKVSLMDMMTKLGEAKVATGLSKSVQTGAAIDLILDDIGWGAGSSFRDIDAGATTIRWFCADGDSALEVLGKIVEAEGPPAIAYVDPSNGKFVFRDRHHRLVDSASKTLQQTFLATGSEPLFSSPMTYDVGWKDLVNEVVVDVQEREPAQQATIWSSDETIILGNNEVRNIDIRTDDPFFDAFAPVASVTNSLNDYDLILGAVTPTIDRTNGQSLRLTLTAGAAGAHIERMGIRGKSVPVTRTVRVIKQDATSVTLNGVRTLQDADLSYASRNDADAVGQVIIDQRKIRLPITSITVNNANDTRRAAQLDRKLSDRIHITESVQTFIDDDYFIERIEHDIKEAGKDHTVVFACERAVTAAGATPPFILGGGGGSFGTLGTAVLGF